MEGFTLNWLRFLMWVFLVSGFLMAAGGRALSVSSLTVLVLSALLKDATGSSSRIYSTKTWEIMSSVLIVTGGLLTGARW